MRAVHEQAAIHGFGDERSALDGEFDTDHQALAANFANEAELFGESGDAFADFGASSPDILEELLILDDGERLERGGTDQRATAKSCTVQAG